MALTEEQLEVLGNRLVPLFQAFERAVINDVVRRLKKTERLTETAEIMAETLRDKGFSPTAIYTQVMKTINADKRLQEAIAVNTLEAKTLLAEEIRMLRENVRVESEGLWEDAGNMAFNKDLSVWKTGAKPVKNSAFDKLVKAMAASATDELLNLTKSLGFRMMSGANVRAAQIYRHELNLAFTKVASGAYSYGQAVEEAVRELAKSGIRTVDFESGVARQVDTAVRNAVMTASSQLAGQITMQNVEQTGVDHVEVSAHWGAREGVGHANHAGWQGKVYRVQGSDGEYENLEETTGYPSDPKGLCGYNCRHTFYPFWPGISEPTEWPPEPGPFELDGRTYTYYQATQEQRRREREIRALKREESAYEAAGLKDKAKETARKIRIKSTEYREFSENVGIRAKTERLRVCEGTITKNLKGAGSYGIMTVSDTNGGGGVSVFAKIDRSRYSTIEPNITTDEVVITDERIQHINERHPGDWDRYGKYLKKSVEDPDLIVRDNNPSTAVCLRRVETDEGEKYMRATLRLHTEKDEVGKQNSILTYQKINKKEYGRLSRSKNVVYKRE